MQASPSWTLRPAFDKCGGDERDHGLALLVGAGRLNADQPKSRAAAGWPLVHHRTGIVDGVADVDGFEPFQIAETERRTDNADGLPAPARLVVELAAVIDHQPHAHGGGMPAGSAERAEM